MQFKRLALITLVVFLFVLYLKDPSHDWLAFIGGCMTLHDGMQRFLRRK